MYKNCAVFQKVKALMLALIGFLTFHKESLFSEECRGKIDVGPAFVHLDVLEHEKTVKGIDMPAVRADATFLIWKGVALKPVILYGSNEGNLVAGGIGLGHCTPLTDNLLITPSFGCNFSHLHTFINLPQLGLRHLKEKFRSVSPYIQLEGSYTFAACWRICLSVQYAWSRTHVFIKEITHHGKGHSKGPCYSFLLERDLNDRWSINFGGTYNISLDKEKHGLRAYGFKIGICRWFYSN